MKSLGDLLDHIATPFIFISLLLVSGACWFIGLEISEQTKYQIACTGVICLEVWYLIIILR